MNQARREQIKSLFIAALEQDVSERRTYLDAACGGDRALRAEVEALLAGHDADPTERFLRPVKFDPDGDSSSAEGEDRRVGQRVGSYEIQARMGAGGMGVVYRAARIDDYRQTVAIKLVKRGMDTDEVLHRFKNEMQLLASLGEHPNIARLLDAGTTEDGLPYFVMEFIEGHWIDRYCDDCKLSIRQRLELFRTVCAAVQFAHQRGVIHRDLKPSNVLITSDRLPKLIDFGIAKLLSRAGDGQATATTRADARAMTPHYASPEQMRGDAISTASDVYSLGVVLYELLTGQRPYRLTGFSTAEIERAVLEQQPRKPSTAVGTAKQIASTQGATPEARPESIGDARSESLPRLKKLLAGDLDNIVLKALHKVPQDRYSSVAQLSADLQRFLDGRPVDARPITVAGRGWRWLKRNPTVGGMAAALVVLLLATAIGSTAAAVRFRQQRNALSVARNRAQHEAETARRVTQLLTSIYESSDPYAVAVAPSPGRLLASHNAQEVATLASGAERAIAELSDRPEAQVRLMHSVGVAYLQLGQWENAERLLKRSLRMVREANGPDHLDVATNALYLARAYLARRQYALAEPLLQDARRIFQQDVDGHPLLGPTEFLLGQVAVDRGDRNEAVALYRAALRRITKHLPASQEKLRQLVDATADSLVLINEADYDFKIIFTTEIPFLLEGLIFVVNHPGDDDPVATIELFRDLFLQFVAENYEGAAELGRKGLAPARRIFGARHANVAMLTAMIGWAEYYSDDYDAAEPYFQEALTLAREALGEKHPYVTSIMAYVGLNYMWQGRLDDAERTLGEAARNAQQLPAGTYPELVAAVQRQYAAVLRKNGKTAEAVEFERRADQLRSAK